MRHHRLLVSAVVALALFASTARADRADSEKQIKDRTAEFAAAWEKHDAKAAAAFWTEDGDLIDPSGVTSKGRDEIERYFTKMFTGPFKDSVNKLTVSNVRLVGDDVAIVDWDAVINGAQGPDGKPMPDWKHHVVIVMQKQAGAWNFLVARPYAFEPGPGPTSMPDGDK